MTAKPKVVAFLPAKGTSSRIENKNLKLLDGQPLFTHLLKTLTRCPVIDEVYLDTESDQVIEAAGEIDVRILRRDPGLAANSVDGNQLFMNQVRQVDADIYVQALGTSPFIAAETIEEAVAVLERDPAYDSVVLVKREKLYTWERGRPAYDIERIPNSVDLPDTVIETMGLYVVRREAALRTGRRVGDRPYLLEASPTEAVDVNVPEEFRLAELIAAGRREKERQLYASIRANLTSSMLSDVLDDFGYRDQSVRFLMPNLPEARILGRASTLKLRAMREGEDFRGIYDALQSYETIVPGDVIMVENEVSTFAYFGELNANLAVRAGACGVIIDGLTRDAAEVRRTGLPVFSRGTSCQDVRKRAVVESYGRTIELQGVKVRPGSLVFADSEGVIVVPEQIERQVIEAVHDRVSKEKRILVDIAVGRSAHDIMREHGAF